MRCFDMHIQIVMSCLLCVLPLCCSVSAEHLEHLEFPGTGHEQQTAPVCPVADIKGQDTKLLLVDPFYYQFQGCMCLAGYTPAITKQNNTTVAMVCEQHPGKQVGCLHAQLLLGLLLARQQPNRQCCLRYCIFTS
jgi:hypothetical protein